MGLFGGGSSRSVDRKIGQAFNSVRGVNVGASDLIQRIQQLVGNQLGQGFDLSAVPYQIPGENVLSDAANLAGLDLVAGGLGAAGRQASIDSLTTTGAERYLDPALFEQFFQTNIARPARRDFTNSLDQAANYVAGLGGNRSGGFGRILGDTVTEFDERLQGSRTSLMTDLALRGAASEDARLARVPYVLQGATIPAGFAAMLGSDLFGREQLRGAEDFQRFMLGQPFNNPYVTNFLNLATGVFNPGLEAQLAAMT